MAELKVSYGELGTAIQLSQEITKELASSYQTVSELKNYLNSAGWSGQTRNAFLTYIDLIHQYHSDLLAIMESHNSALSGLKTSVDEYNSSSEVATIKGF